MHKRVLSTFYVLKYDWANAGPAFYSSLVSTRLNLIICFFFGVTVLSSWSLLDKSGVI